jgi:hypothetical protein
VFEHGHPSRELSGLSHVFLLKVQNFIWLENIEAKRELAWCPFFAAGGAAIFSNSAIPENHISGDINHLLLGAHPFKLDRPHLFA